MAFRTLTRGVATSSTSSSPSAIASSSVTSSARRLFSSTPRSNEHHLPELPARLKEGCMPLLSKSTVEMLWYGRQKELLEKLNREVRGDDELGNATLVHTIIKTAEKPLDIAAFNYASHALNNAFFLSGIVSPQGISQTAMDDSYKDLPLNEPTERIAGLLKENFGSVAEFKGAFSAAAYGMSGSGYVWLVQSTQKSLGIVPTYGGGTILVQKRLQRFPPGFQEQASKTDDQGASPQQPAADADGESAKEAIQQALKTTTVGVSSPRDSNNKVLVPLLCLSVHEHAWMPDWGICGKEEYLTRFWDAVDWRRVDALCP